MVKIERFACNMLAENCFILSDETKECVIIDCGAFREEERKAIVNYIKKEDLKPVHLLATHGHLDHHFGDNTIFTEYGLKPEVHEGDRVFMENPYNAATTLFGITLDYELPEANFCIENTSIINFGSHTLKVIATPGHSGGQCAIIVKTSIYFLRVIRFSEEVLAEPTSLEVVCFRWLAPYVY